MPTCKGASIRETERGKEKPDATENSQSSNIPALMQNAALPEFNLSVGPKSEVVSAQQG